jgi:cellobiose-specific phosphotransferase system component IIC
MSDILDADLTQLTEGNEEAAAQLGALRDGAPGYLTVTILGTILILAVAARAFVTVRPRIESREQTLQATNWLILQIGALTFAADLAVQFLFSEEARGGATSGLIAILFFHLLPSVFMP